MKRIRENFVSLLAVAVLLSGAPAALAESSAEKAPEAATTNPVVKIKTSMGEITAELDAKNAPCLLYTSPSPRDQRGSRMPSSA